jgi:enoyl reductase-like protein
MEHINITDVQQAMSIYSSYKNIKHKLLKTNAAIWFIKICRNSKPKNVNFKKVYCITNNVTIMQRYLCSKWFCANNMRFSLKMEYITCQNTKERCDKICIKHKCASVWNIEGVLNVTECRG